MVPDGDRRHVAESGSVVAKEKPVLERDEQIESELVLRYQVLGNQRRYLGEEPGQCSLQRDMRFHCALDGGEDFRGEAGSVFYGDCSGHRRRTSGPQLWALGQLANHGTY